MNDIQELINEARERFAEAGRIRDSMSVTRMLLVAGFVPRLADALEALTRENEEMYAYYEDKARAER